MKLRTPASIFVPLVLITITGAFMMIIGNDQPSQSGFMGMIANAFNSLLATFKNVYFWGVIAIALVMLMIVNNINKMIETQKFNQLTETEKQAYLEKKKTGYLKNLWNSRAEKQSDEEEQSIILDHGFDGITELDNSLPQWWLAMFWMGVIFMVVYVLAYFSTDFANPIKEYEEETVYLENKFAKWIKNNDITIDGAVNKQDEATLAAGKETFTNVCATCHTANGGGAAGPNLTDDYWINQVQDSLFYNIYDIVYNGSPNNPAMKAFGQEKELTGLDIEAVAAYVYQLNMDDKNNVTEAQGGLAPQGTIAPWYGNATNNAQPTTPNQPNQEETKEQPTEDANPQKTEEMAYLK